MNPSNKENSSTQLPLPEQTPVVDQAREAVEQSAEQPVGLAEQTPAPQPAAAPPMIMPTTATIPLPAPTAVPQSSTKPPANDLQIDDDGDLIEKEWVNKAKQIVERNRDDPYKQSEALTVFKADYMKKRYDKTIKVSQ